MSELVPVFTAEHFVSDEVIRELTERLEPPATRLGFALDRVRNCAALNRQHATRRAIMLAGMILDLPYTYAGRLFRDLQDYNSADLPDWAVAAVGKLRKKHVGHVYYAEPADGAAVFKIGFSRDPLRRIEQVSRFYGVRFGAVGSLAGTMLCEHWTHCGRDAYRIVDEWFFNWTAQERPPVPEFLLRYRGRGAAEPARIPA